MAEKAEKTEEPEKSGKKEKKKKGNLLQIIILVLLVAVLGLGGFIAWKLMYMQLPPVAQQAKDHAPDQKERAPGILLELDNLTVNLADTEESRFLRVKIKLEVTSEEDKARIEALKTQIRDLIITLLSSRTFNDVRTPQGKFALKEELVYRINNLAGGHPVKTLYFTDFVAQ